jgi:hypothetical protein
MNEIFPTYKGLRIVIASRVVDRELIELGLDLWDVKEILETGFDCPIGRRKPNIEEKCVKVGMKVIKVIVEKSEVEEENVWKLRHAGMFAWKKRRFET